MTREISLTMSDGTKRKFPHASRINVSNVSSKHILLDEGKIRYTFTLDTREAETIRVGDHRGDVGDIEDNPNFKSQNGWFGAGWRWFAMDEGERSEHSEFSLVSEWLPGPVAVMIQGRNTTVSPSSPGSPTGHISSFDREAIGWATNIHRNSIRRTVIGPAIPPCASDETLIRIIRRWVSELNLGFLQPVTKADINLQEALESLKPSTDLERNIVECLRAARLNSQRIRDALREDEAGE